MSNRKLEDDHIYNIMNGAREFYSDDPGRWTTRMTFRDIEGKPLGIDGKNTHSACLGGAIILSAAKIEHAKIETGEPANWIPFDDDHRETYYDWSCARITAKTGANALTTWNDDPKTTFQDILEMLDYLIEIRKTELMGNVNEPRIRSETPVLETCEG